MTEVRDMLFGLLDEVRAQQPVVGYDWVTSQVQPRNEEAQEDAESPADLAYPVPEDPPSEPVAAEDRDPVVAPPRAEVESAEFSPPPVTEESTSPPALPNPPAEQVGQVSDPARVLDSQVVPVLPVEPTAEPPSPPTSPPPPGDAQDATQPVQPPAARVDAPDPPAVPEPASDPVDPPAAPQPPRGDSEPAVQPVAPPPPANNDPPDTPAPPGGQQGAASPPPPSPPPPPQPSRESVQAVRALNPEGEVTVEVLPPRLLPNPDLPMQLPSPVGLGAIEEGAGDAPPMGGIHGLTEDDKIFFADQFMNLHDDLSDEIFEVMEIERAQSARRGLL